MQQSRWKLPAVCAALVALGAPVAAGTASASTMPPGSGYVWAQPGTVPVSAPDAQPPAWVITAPTVTTTFASTGYVWAQPGTAPVSAANAQPPASIPIG